MKYITQYFTMMKVAVLIAKMPIGEGWTVPKDYVTWSGLSRATVYRYLPLMVNNGLLNVKEHGKGKKLRREYRLSQVGREFWNSQKALFGETE